MRELYAHFGDRLVGVFREAGPEYATFEYCDNDPNLTPVSLSLPRHDPLTDVGSQSNAYAYLDGLLPDDDAVRRRWAIARQTNGTDPFSLLAEYGDDVAGAVSLSAFKETQDAQRDIMVEATEDDIAARVASISRESSSWLDPQVRPRMSLGGAQGKFSLTSVGARWFWPTLHSPSTHIFKPPSTHHKRIEIFEDATLKLASDLGIEATRSSREEFLGQPTLVVERWDRWQGTRLHAEDLNQALGNLTAEKYHREKASASRIARLLTPFNQQWRFVEQFAFNVAVGNSDAHAKNYSVLLSGSSVVLAPLYDALPVYFWPQYGGDLAMRVGNATHLGDAGEAVWRKFAQEAFLDPDEVCEVAFRVYSAVSEVMPDHFRACGFDPHRLSLVMKRAKALHRLVPAA
ncbi:MAG: HipA domain-containing protein [Cellulomonadaceae bacterium]|jgi:serine/threonine-protein kinase HipA|nr:HipA domain-containing protein [Cellulomonadaceae bacterium]